MHFTLTSRGNALIGSLWCAVLAVSAVLEPRASAAIVIAFAIVGLAAGLFQGRAIRENSTLLVAAVTSRDVRKVLVSSSPGKLSVALLWIVGAAILVLLFRGGEYGTLSTAIGSYAAFSLAREMASLPAVVALAKP